ncbi:MAG: YciI family protein [Pseudomonadota bacterium]
MKVFMRWIAIFTDTPEMLDIRREREHLHLAYLQANDSEILIAGGCREAPGAVFVGGLWVLSVDSRERAVELIENDPYYVPSCRSYQLLIWGKAFADKMVVL